MNKTYLTRLNLFPNIFLSRSRSIISIILFFLVHNMLFAQVNESNQFKEKYELKEVVVLTRHNSKTPLSGKNNILRKITNYKWINWTANASELTLRGGILETMMGQYFRKWLEKEGLFKERYCPNSDEINIYANSMQRTIATAEYFKGGFLPICNDNIYHRFAPSKMDPLFFPRLTKVSDSLKLQAMKEINAIGAKKGLIGLTETFKPSFEIVEKLTDMSNSPECKQDNICTLNDYNTQVIFKLGEKPNISGCLKLDNTIADALILQYFGASNDKEAAFGNDLTTKDWEKISKIKDIYGDILFTAPIVAINVAHPLLVYMKDELMSTDRKFTYLVGHNFNISSITSALTFENYSLPNTIEKKTPIGCKLNFEKWIDKSYNELYVSTKLLYESSVQLKNLKPLDLSNPPPSYPMKIVGLTSSEFGLYRFNDIINQFDKAILAYEAINQ